MVGQNQIIKNKNNNNLARKKNHVYVNLDRKLVEVVNKCVASIFENGANVYQSKKDFVTKAIQRQIDIEKAINQKLKQEIDLMLVNNSNNSNNKNVGGGNGGKNE